VPPHAIEFTHRPIGNKGDRYSDYLPRQNPDSLRGKHFPAFTINRHLALAVNDFNHGGYPQITRISDFRKNKRNTPARVRSFV
jgi:hypothetical protein